jgi:hypothetical protein
LATSGPAWTSSPASPGAAGCRRADHHDFGEGDGGADRIRMLVEQAGIEIGRAEGFGEAVHQEDLGRREQLAHPPHDRHRQPPPLNW